MVTNQKPGKEILDEWHRDPANWKWGIFYYNKKDKRIFPPKKFKSFGWTVNFANPISIMVLAGLIILMTLIGLYLNNRL